MYNEIIRETLAKHGRLGTNPRHVEAWMRVERRTLDGVSPADFRGMVLAAAACVRAATPAQNEALADSFGL